MNIEIHRLGTAPRSLIDIGYNAYPNNYSEIRTFSSVRITIDYYAILPTLPLAVATLQIWFLKPCDMFITLQRITYRPPIVIF